MKKHEWESTVLTVKNGYWGRNEKTDPNLINSFKGKVYRTRMFYPGKNMGNGPAGKMIRRIWSEISFPDDKIFWTLSAAFKARKLLRHEKFDCVFITGWPFSSFLISLVLNKRFNLPICIDYRDPWTGRLYIKRKWKRTLSKKLEKLVLKKADKVFSVTQKMTEYIKEHSGINQEETDKFSTLTYSFSPETTALIDNNMPSSKKFNLIFAGSSLGATNPKPLLEAVLLLKNAQKEIYTDIQITVIGDLLNTWEKWIEEHELQDKVQINDYMPYQEALNYMNASHALLLPYKENDHMKICLPVKIFDYFLLQKPILFYGPEGQIWETIKKTRTGYCRLPIDIEGIAADICTIYKDYYRGNMTLSPDLEVINQFNTANVIKKFIRDLETLLPS